MGLEWVAAVSAAAAVETMWGRWWVFGEGSSKKVLKDDVVVGGGFLVLEGGKIDVLPDLFHGFGRS
ncbi:hypothetical protein FH972_006368 [Carpinus fangiana]|uniref:Uncharacterized protein n=1 Tax=Carpinus fangiana TaxID=176857 RepID=A0A5N6QS24_9ROSI|nr:hypothetical protein FH972_006368 [Carpinus fangiana]